MHISPVNVSVHTTNPELRVKMMKNKRSGEVLSYLRRLADAGIKLCCQIVLCKGVNDKEELERSIRDLYDYLPHLRSLSVVPVGLSRFRDGLYDLLPFTGEDATEVLGTIHRWQEKAYEEHGLHFVHASDEWYLMAGEELPEEDRYDGYLQLENGVGMLRLFTEEFEEELARIRQRMETQNEKLQCKETITLITGRLAYPCIRALADRLLSMTEGLILQVMAVRNDFFGERITVSGLLTGRDIIAQCSGLHLGDRVLLPENVLRSGEDVLLDDYTLEDLKKALQVPIDIVKSSGYQLVQCILGERAWEAEKGNPS